MRNNRSGFLYSIIQVGYWMDFAVTATFSAVFLSGIGFTPVQIGYVTTIAAVLSTILQPLLASVADRAKRITLKEILAACFGLGAICALALHFLRGSHAAAFVFVFVIISLSSSVQPLLSAYCIQLDEAGVRINFGIARALGSVGYALGGFLMGELTKRFGITIIFPTYCAVLVVILLVLFLMPNLHLARRKAAEKNLEAIQEAGNSSSLIEFFKKYRRFDVLLLAIVLTLFMQIVQNTYMIYFVRNYGGNEADMGRVVLLMSMSEVPTIAVSLYLMKKFSVRWMLRCYAIFDFLQFALMLVLPNITCYVLLQLMHLVSTGMYQVPIVYYANSAVEQKDQVKAQAIIGAATNGVSAVLANIIGGYLFSSLPVRGVIIVGSAVTLVGSILFFVVTAKGAFPDEKMRPMPWEMNRQ